MTTAVAINEVLKEECIILDVDCQTKEQIISQLTDLLCQTGAVTDKAAFLKDVYLREELGSTGFENHIAIPHGKSAAVAKTRIAVVVYARIFRGRPSTALKSGWLFCSR